MNKTKYLISEKQLINFCNDVTIPLEVNSMLDAVMRFKKCIKQQPLKPRQLEWHPIGMDTFICKINKELWYLIECVYKGHIILRLIDNIEDRYHESIPQLHLGSFKSIIEARDFAQSHFNQMYEEMSDAM